VRVLKKKLIWRKKRKDNPDSADTEMDVDPVPEITRAHFEESMKYARRSVSPNDVRKYEMFKQTLVQSRGLGNWKFPESAGGESGSGTNPGQNQNQQFANNDDGEDLYS